MKLLLGAEKAVRDLFEGRVALPEWLERLVYAFWPMPGYRPYPPEEGGLPPELCPVPVRPSPSHRLIAMRDLPPRDGTHLLPYE